MLTDMTLNKTEHVLMRFSISHQYHLSNVLLNRSRFRDPRPCSVILAGNTIGEAKYIGIVLVTMLPDRDRVNSLCNSVTLRFYTSRGDEEGRAKLGISSMTNRPSRDEVTASDPSSSSSSLCRS